MSTFTEWEPLESLSGTFEAHHYEVGKLLYLDCTTSELLQCSIYFYDAEYIVPTSRESFGTLWALSAPPLMDLDWPRSNNTLVALIKRQIEIDVCIAMKCTYDSHRATLTSFMPLHLFAFLFKDAEVHRTPKMWIAKAGAAMNAFLPPSWDLKVAQRQGDTIWRMVVSEMMVI